MTNWVKFTPKIGSNATYKVALYWNATAKDEYQYDRARGVNVPVEICYDGGTVTNIVDMSVQPADWFELGNWPFKVGESGFVRILTEGVIAIVLTTNSLTSAYSIEACLSSAEAICARVA